MAVTNLYPNLPGHLVEFKDGGLQLTSNDNEVAGGKSLLILGTAFDGPVNEPVKIDATTVSQLFGSEVNENGYPNGATLTKYAKQAFKNGFSDVRCMRVTGSQAFTTVTKEIVVSTETLDDEYEGVIEGNQAVSNISLDNPAIVEDSVVIRSASGASIQPSGAYALYDTLISIPADVVSKNATVNIEYTYKDIQSATDSFDAGDGTFTIADNIFVCPKDGLGAYVSSNVPQTDGPVLSSAGVTLTEGTDYNIDLTTGVITILASATVMAGDTVDIAYYKYTTAPASQSFTCVDDDQVVTLEHTPKAGSIVVTCNSSVVNASDYVVDTNAAGKTVVKLTAGNFSKGDPCVVSYQYEVANTTSDSMIVRAIYGGSLYKSAKFQIVDVEDTDGSVTGTAGKVYKKFIFTKPTSKKYTASEAPLSATSVACPTVGYLKNVLANAALNNVFEIICDDDDMSTEDFPIFESFLTDGGEDGVGVDNNTMFEALSGKRDEYGYLIAQGAYQILENYNVDYIYPAGVYADSKQTVNKNSSFHHELALLCAVLTYRTKMTHGFIDVKPNSNTTLVGVQTYVDKLLAYNNDHFMKDENGDDIIDAEGNKMDIGWYTSVVVGPEPVMVSDTLGNYYGSPAIAYAALNASLAPQSAPTNKALPGVKGMKFKFSNKQMNELVGNRFVVFKLKNEGTATASSIPYVVDGCTAGAATSDYTRLSTVKIVTDVVDQIREVADPFIGEPNTIEQRNALSALISKRLSYLMEQGEIQYFEFEINATIQQVVLGECSIALTLVPPMELRKITTVVALRAAA